MLARFGLACVSLALLGGIARAQSPEPRDSWLMQNYRFSGPPAPGATPAVDPVVAQLQEIQNTTLAILRKANFAGDYDAALAAAAQAAANAQLIGAITERQRSERMQKTSATAATDEESPKPSVYLIAMRDQTIQAATSYWTDGVMLHCITLEGAHEQIRLDLVDRKLSSALNQRRNVAFHIPEQKERHY